MNNILKDIVYHDVLMIINEYMDNIKTSCNGCSKTKFDKYCVKCDEFKCGECDMFINGECLKCLNDIYINCCHICYIIKDLTKCKHCCLYICSKCIYKCNCNPNLISILNPYYNYLRRNHFKKPN